MKRKAIRFADGLWWLYEIGEEIGAPFEKHRNAVKAQSFFDLLLFSKLPKELQR